MKFRLEFQDDGQVDVFDEEAGLYIASFWPETGRQRSYAELLIEALKIGHLYLERKYNVERNPNPSPKQP